MTWFSWLKERFTVRIQPKANLAEALLSFVDPRSPYLIGVFICGLFLLSILGNFIYTVILEGMAFERAVWFRLGWWVIALLVLGIAFYIFDIWKRQEILKEVGVMLDGSWESSKDAKHYPGLIAVFNPFNPELNKFIVRHHTHPDIHKKRQLRYCWCIMDQKPETLEKFRIFQDDMKESHVEFLSYFIDDTKNVQETYLAVDLIYRKEIRQKQLYTLDVVTNITPGITPMSVGMAFACLMYDRHVEYIYSEYDKANNRIKPETTKVIEIDVNFYLKQRR